MKGELMHYSHKEIYILETNANSESTHLAKLFASHGTRKPIKCKPSTKLKQKLNPILDFFTQNKTEKTETNQDHKVVASIDEVQVPKCPPSISNKTKNRKQRKNSIDLYKEAAAILGLTCSQTDSCRCLECQCHYFDFEEEIDLDDEDECVEDHDWSCSIQ